MMNGRKVEKFTTQTGRQIFRIPVQTFPKLVNYVYLVTDDGMTRLIDTGLGTDMSMTEIAEGIEEVRSTFGAHISLDTVQEIIITHGHIDHFGGLRQMKTQTTARVLIHELDARILMNFAERLIVASKDLGVFLKRAGVSERIRRPLQEMYTASKEFFSSIPVDRPLKDGDSLGEGITVIHTPGHCPGHICLLVDDVLFAGDHILSRITPHLSPQSITHFCGVDHYMESLAKLKSTAGVSLTLPAHQDPITDLPGRIAEIEAFHGERLSKVLELCREPKSISHISIELFGELREYNIILALEETGAHVEYLYEHGKLGVANLDEIKRDEDPVLYYRSL